MGTRHDTKYYTMPKGLLLWKTDSKAGYEDLGNVSKVEITEEVETLEHFSSRGGMQVRDFYAVKSIKANGAFTFDSIHRENLMRYFMADGSTTTSQAEGSATEVALSAVQRNRWHEIGAVDLSNVVVKDEAKAVTYEEGKDYEIRLGAGQIFILDSGGISDDDDIYVTYDNAAATLDEFIGGVKAAKGHIFFSAEPPFGEIIDIKAYGLLIPDGAIAMVSEEIATVSMKLEMLAHANYAPGLMLVKRRGNVSAETI